MRGPLVLSVVVLVVLAGCSMPAGDDRARTDTVTPVPVTDAESVDRVTVETTTSERVGPPNRPDGGEFADLLDDHERHLENATYASRISIEGIDERGIENRTNITVRSFRGTNDSVYYREQRTADGRELAWSNGTVHVSLRERGNQTTTSVSREIRPGTPARYLGDVDRLRTIFAFARPTEITENDTHYRINATFVPKDGRSLLGASATIENSSLSMTVADEGVIEAYRLEIVGRSDSGERIDITERFSLDRSADPLPRPEWVDAAIQNETG